MANAQNLNTNEEVPLNITLTGNDVDGDPFTFSIVTPPANGTLSGSRASRTYTPNTNFEGVDSLVFQVTDTQGGTGTATVSITVNPVQDPPTQVNLSSTSLPENSPVNSSVGSLTTIDPDAGETFTYAFAAGTGDTDNGLFVITGDSHTVTINWGDGSAATTLNLGPGITSFSVAHAFADDKPTGTAVDLTTVTVTVSDGQFSSAASTTINVSNVAPALSNQSVTTSITEGGVATLTADILDPGILDTFTLVVDWGERSPQTYLIAAGLVQGGNIFLTGHDVLSHPTSPNGYQNRFNPNLNRHSNKNPQHSPVFFR